MTWLVLLCCFDAAVLIAFARVMWRIAEDSISGLIARRYMTEAYAMLIMLTVFATAVSATVIMCAMFSELNQYAAAYHGFFFCGALAPLLMLLIVIFPLVVWRPSTSLDMIPCPIGEDERKEMQQPDSKKFIVMSVTGVPYDDDVKAAQVSESVSSTRASSGSIEEAKEQSSSVRSRRQRLTIHDDPLDIELVPVGAQPVSRKPVSVDELSLTPFGLPVNELVEEVVGPSGI